MSRKGNHVSDLIMNNILHQVYLLGENLLYVYFIYFSYSLISFVFSKICTTCCCDVDTLTS